MAEFLVRVTDKTSDDPYRDVRLTKRGDVIVVRPDGWSWGSDELTAPFWRIVIHSDMDLSEAEEFLAEEPETDPQHPSRMLQRRAFKIRLDAPFLPPAVQAFFADDTRTASSLNLTGLITIGQLRALKFKKPTVPDPNVIG